jgi:hypothetical protein
LKEAHLLERGLLSAMFNLGNVIFGLKDLDLTLGIRYLHGFEKSRTFPWYAASADSTNTIGPKSHLSYLNKVFHPK